MKDRSFIPVKADIFGEWERYCTGTWYSGAVEIDLPDNDYKNGFERWGFNNKQFHFPSGLGLSVITFGHGADAGLFETALLNDGNLKYDGLIGYDDVKGWLTKEQVIEELKKVQFYSELLEKGDSAVATLLLGGNE